jgi:hypothetical protein
MASSTVRDHVVRSVREMPEDATFEAIMERIYMLQKVERGRMQIERGEGIPHDEAKRQMKRWHE